MTNRQKAGGLWALGLAWLMVVAPHSHGQSCDSIEGVESICGLMAPEDIVIAPNGRDLIFSQFGAGGSLSLLDTRDNSVKPLYSGAVAGVNTAELWGAPSCTAAPTGIWPHGIDLNQRSDGRWQLLVVNHAERESVEFFELQQVNGEITGLQWRGCAVVPESANINDVSGLPDGGFITSNMYTSAPQLWLLIKSVLGFDTGFVYRWKPTTGFAKIPGTEGKLPNGLVLSPDKKSFFVNMYFEDQMHKYELSSGKLLGKVDIAKPDNVTLTADGRLLVASQLGSIFEVMGSLESKEPSLLPFEIVEVDPQSLAKRIVLSLQGKPMGAGTVAVEQGGFWYIGSYAGDRMIKVAMPKG